MFLCGKIPDKQYYKVQLTAVYRSPLLPSRQQDIMRALLAREWTWISVKSRRCSWKLGISGKSTTSTGPKYAPDKLMGNRRVHFRSHLPTLYFQTNGEASVYHRDRVQETQKWENYAPSKSFFLTDSTACYIT